MSLSPGRGGARGRSAARRAAEGLALRGMATVHTARACRSRSVAGSPYPRSAVTERGVRPPRRAIRLIAGASWGASGLQLDPSVDIVGNRLPNVWVKSRQAGEHIF